MAQKKIIEIVKKYVQKLKENNVDVFKVFLYGSQVLGTYNEYSDIDVAVISPNFGKNYLEECRLLMKLTRNVDLMISPQPYAVEEYEKASKGTFLWQEIIQKGKVIE